MKHLFSLLVFLSFSAYANKLPLNIKKEAKPQISFTENKGQICDQNYKPRTDVLFSGTDGKLTFHIKNNGVSYQLNRVDKWKEEERIGKTNEKIKVPDQTTVYRIDANWLNSNSDYTQETIDALPGYNNYYLEQCPNGALNVKSYKAITLKNLYNKIDIHYYEKDGVLKYDYIVAPHANYKQIQIEIKGAEIELQSDGSLLLKTPLGDVQEGRPVAYQNGKQLPTRWKIVNNILSFEVDNCKMESELVIDPPTRLWGTYFGGSATEGFYSSAIDNLSNMYISGGTSTSTSGVIATSGSHQTIIGSSMDSYLAKFDALGVRLWGTYYGGASNEQGRSCATDQSGNVFLAGDVSSATSTLVIATIGSHQTSYGGGSTDAFLVKFNSSGVRQWGTYYGGSGTEIPYSCHCDIAGNVLLFGTTLTSGGSMISTIGSHQISSGGGSDAFLVKLSSSGVRQWGTYYGGNGNEEGFGCETDVSGNIIISGYTTSSGGTAIATVGSHQSVLIGGSDAFLAKFNSFGVRQWGTYYGGAANDYAYACTVSNSGDIFITGPTQSNSGTNIATLGSHQSSFGGGTVNDAYLAKFDGSGIRQWGTYYGNIGNDYGTSCTTDNLGNVYLCGVAFSSVSIASPGSYQPTIGSTTTSDAFVVKFNSVGVRHWGTYYGGASYDDCWGIEIFGSGDIYLAGSTQSSSGNIIATVGSHQNTYGGGSSDAFITKFNDCIPDLPGPISGPSSICSAGGSQTYSVPVISNADFYTWSLPSGCTGTSTTNIMSLMPGGIGGTMSITATNTCGITPVNILIIAVNSTPTISVNNATICTGQSFTISPSGASSYTYSSGSAIVSPTSTTSYTVVGSSLGCLSNVVTSNFYVNPLPVVTSTTSSTLICGPPFQGNAILTAGGATSYTWNTSATTNSISVSPSVTTTYSVTGADANGCENTAIITQSVSACTGLNEIKIESSGLEIFPNPTNGFLTVIVPYSSNEEIEVYNVIGEIVLKTEIKENKVEIDLLEKASGIYFIKVGNLTKKIIKQ